VDGFSSPGGIAVALDGSAHSYGALKGAIALAAKMNKDIEIVTVTGDDATETDLLNKHLAAAAKLVEKAGLKVTTKALSGEAVSALRGHMVAAKPWALAIGRVGIDGRSEDIGSTTDNLLRVSEVNLLVASQSWRPGKQAEVEAVAIAK
jgi:nucleotide-binding universal stress UspA family protein